MITLRYLTRFCLQAQFYMILFNIAAVLYGTNFGGCNFPAWMGWAWLFYCLTMIALFTSFYMRAYIRGERLGAAKGDKAKVLP